MVSALSGSPFRRMAAESQAFTKLWDAYLSRESDEPPFACAELNVKRPRCAKIMKARKYLLIFIKSSLP
jgi:hypothetical protein